MQRSWLASQKFGSQADVAAAGPTSEPKLRLTIVNALTLDNLLHGYGAQSTASL